MFSPEGKYLSCHWLYLWLSSIFRRFGLPLSKGHRERHQKASKFQDSALDPLYTCFCFTCDLLSKHIYGCLERALSLEASRAHWWIVLTLLLSPYSQRRLQRWHSQSTITLWSQIEYLPFLPQLLWIKFGWWIWTEKHLTELPESLLYPPAFLLWFPRSWLEVGQHLARHLPTSSHVFCPSSASCHASSHFWSPTFHPWT